MATNRIDILDPALLRPGRIDRKIEFPNPDETSRFDILKIHSRKMNLQRGIDLKKIAEGMTGSSGAELKAVCTEAGMFALRERRVHVTQVGGAGRARGGVGMPRGERGGHWGAGDRGEGPLWIAAWHACLFPAPVWAPHPACLPAYLPLPRCLPAAACPPAPGSRRRTLR